jgi:hypothetical protein
MYHDGEYFLGVFAVGMNVGYMRSEILLHIPYDGSEAVTSTLEKS